MAELQEDASELPFQQQSRLLESLDRLRVALRDLQVADEAIRLLLSAVQQSRDSIVITGATLDPPGPEIVYVNPAFSEMTGYTSEEMLGKTPRILQGKDTDRTVLHALRQHLEEKKPFHGEAINYHKDGSTFFVEWNITPIRNAQDRVTHFVAIQRDISDRKRFEQELENSLAQEQAARSEAEIANQAKDEFLAMLSHELRTPLTPILGWSKVLQTKQLSREQEQTALETIEENAKRQAQLVDDLLDLSRITQGKLTLTLTPVTLLEPIKAALKTVSGAAEAKSIQIETRFDRSVKTVLGDAGRLQQVFWNLLANAIKFTPINGRITLKLDRRDRIARITISDTGKGISADFLPFVFDRFRQQDSSITREFGGLGLGLALCRQLVEAHGGTIEVASPGVGKGATFTLQLPIAGDAPSVSAAKFDNDKPDLQNVRVLVVDDEVSTLEFVGFVLEQEGAIVSQAASAQGAIDLLMKSPFDVLISDIGMQDVDGYTLLRRIRASDSPNQAVKAIALTAYATELNKQQALSAGYQCHLAKPFELNALVSTIVTVLNPSS